MIEYCACRVYFLSPRAGQPSWAHAETDRIEVHQRHDAISSEVGALAGLRRWTCHLHTQTLGAGALLLRTAEHIGRLFCPSDQTLQSTSSRKLSSYPAAAAVSAKVTVGHGITVA
ncbi:hypothetical protein CMEL01_00283 [Colletotrichum melonis]|uniref:Uncharacterized protein n=1 Tax=Colletotrichum melonis TaxID=1209925 RepID=A0AAI9V2X5_9PEZI|nr:hypothetical protein CMEL01_00283 [Colletotrichum melonis]